ncbi:MULTISPECIES: polysaccharide biosynthesis/export family protein [unclassified Sphingobacterium]|uniref:polysaccharide biosynthesis/export family protein n=1 Tax=unclassified Sphingobacterium TaxID=2609468 RepID=UPI0010526A28|nr:MULTISPECIES: polysaccharide biosynthesis/export family protein [unclassified Sphingobacterium]MCS3555850.1 polysaccharide export outer membrane protein [Sphingobacterium sp. JUb21]TCR00697.1 polysaccharide export outer membrane protein [Sphingobacterium sp. JUb20]
MRLISKYGLTLGILVVFLMFFSSCGSRKSMVYFQPDSTRINTIYEQYVPKIQKNDILTVVVTAADPKVTAPFNPLSTMTTTNMSQGVDMALRPTYTVNEEGAITLPMLGKVQIAGLTRLEAIEKIRTELSQYIKDPGVNMNFNNFRVSVLGEVARPGSFIMPTERVTVLEALGMAGDLTIRGIRENVTLIREVDGQKTIHRLDLTKQETLNSPYYYLAQNDVIYVEPNKAQINNSKLGANTNIIISIAGLIITVISVLTR